MQHSKQLISIVVPCYNEAASIAGLHGQLAAVMEKEADYSFEQIYVNDGSTDGTLDRLQELATTDKTIRILSLTRNFGKEIATTAGITHAHGQAIITLDADGQHPVELLPAFLASWQSGHAVVIGIRKDNQREGLLKRYGSKIFYSLFNRFTGIKLLPGSTDFRLIDQAVQREFIRMPERNRITRGLIDWLGYDRDYIEFKANARLDGAAGYTFKKLLKLAVDSVVSLSLSPLYITAYIGAVVLPVSTLLGIFMLINALFGDPLNLHATGGAYVMVLMLFLIGVLLVSQGIIGLYLSHIHTETQNRPLFVIDDAKSRGV